MKLPLFTALACTATVAGAATFHEPVRLKAGDNYIRVESPGYAFPCWADIDGDGKKDLLVGQFRDGKVQIYKNLGEGRLAPGEWLQAEGKAAIIPGVW
jgi:hypothetical protein